MERLQHHQLCLPTERQPVVQTAQKGLGQYVRKTINTAFVGPAPVACEHPSPGQLLSVAHPTLSKRPHLCSRGARRPSQGRKQVGWAAGLSTGPWTGGPFMSGPDFLHLPLGRAGCVCRPGMGCSNRAEWRVLRQMLPRLLRAILVLHLRLK